MKKEKTYHIKPILLGLTILLMSLPAAQHVFNFYSSKALNGDIKQVKATTFTSKNWFSGKYAKKTDQYFKHNMGFRPDIVRFDNQIAYSLFGEMRAKGVILGKDDYLYEKSYIDAFTGKDFIGENAIKEKVKKLKSIQDSMQVLGKNLLIILAAGKASFYPEYIPDDLMLKTDSTNYIFYKNELKTQGVNHIDFMDWFLKHKGKMPYPLYPKTGIHWSEYGMILAADSMINRVEALNSSWDLPDLYWDSIDYTHEISGGDDDIELGLNLMTRFPNFKMAYPKIKYDTKDKDSINVIVISDSFFWRMYSHKVMPTAFAEGQFWYYNYSSFPQRFGRETKVEDLDLEKEIEAVDVIIMMSTEANLQSFPWRAEEDFHHYFSGNYSFEKLVWERKIKQMEQKIRSKEKWVSYLKEKAIRLEISLDSMIRRDAVYMVRKESLR